MTARTYERAAFLAAIRDDPDDDAPRLILADWLEEQGDARGEFIRVQCALGSSFWGPAPYYFRRRMDSEDARRGELERREENLLRQYGEAWRGSPVPPGIYVSFDRGLLEIGVDAEILASNQGVQWWTTQKSWVDQLVLRCDDASLQRVVGKDLLTQVPQLDLSGAIITEAGLKHLAGLTQLRTLNLASIQSGTVCAYGVLVTDAGLKQLAGLTQLRTLEVETSSLTSRGLEYLSRLTQLRELYLHGGKVTGAGLKHLAGLTELRRLHIGYCDKMTNAGLKGLAGLTQLSKLSLWGDIYCPSIQFPAGGLKHLARLTQLRRLDLLVGDVTDEVLEQLTGLTQLRTLNLNGAKVTKGGKRKLKKTLPGCDIRW